MGLPPTFATSEAYDEAQLRTDLEILWRAGDLSYGLHPSQLELRKAYYECEDRTFVVCSARQWGKSTWAVTEAVQQCITVPGSLVRYVTGTKKDAADIITPSLQRLLAECPADMRPRHYLKDHRWTFPNGSEIILAGGEKDAGDRIRGLKSHLVIVDEAGFISKLEDLIEGAIRPTTIHTGGRIILVSTPPTTPGHPFVTRYMAEAESAGILQHRTIHDNPLLTEADIEEIAASAGGTESSRWRREYMAEVVTDLSLAIVPEFDEHEHVVSFVPTGNTVKRYVVADYAHTDFTVVGLFEYHFEEACTYLVDELVFHESGALATVEPMLALERDRWEGVAPERRWADIPPLSRKDVSAQHGIYFAEVDKPNKIGRINRLRQQLIEGQFLVHERCEVSIAHLRDGIWKTNRKDFARVSGYGHFDAVDVVLYAVQQIYREQLPHEPVQAPNTFVPPGARDKAAGTAATLKRALAPRRKRRR